MDMVFECESFVDFIRQKESTSPRGFRKMLAEAAACQPSYVTRVMNRQTHFSLEQGALIAHDLRLNKEETSFLLLLLQRDRAGNSLLKNHFEEELDAIRRQKKKIKTVLEIHSEVGVRYDAEYYSSWLYTAAHVLVSLPEFQETSRLAAHLGISVKRAEEVLALLSAAGAVESNGKSKWKVGKGSFHLGTDSPLLSRHHSNWRQQAMQSLDRPHPQDLHYSVIFGVSQKDWERIRNQLLRTIKDCMQVISPSREECAGAFNLDLFRI